MLLWAAAWANAETPPSEGQLAHVRRLYLEAADGNQTSLLGSIRMLHALNADQGRDPVLAAYLGSVLLIESSRTMMPWKKGKLAKEGLQYLDAAVNQAPSHVEVRFLRGVSTFHLPAFFGRRQQSREDLKWLAGRVGIAVENGQLDRRLGAAALFYFGRHCEQDRDSASAREAWAAAARMSPETKAGRESRKLAGGS